MGKALWLIAPLLASATLVAVPSPALADPVEKRTSFPQIEDWSSLLIVLDAKSMYPAGAAYEIEIRADGSVWYEGIADVAAKGPIPLRTTPDAVKALVEKFRAADFFALRAVYRPELWDAGGSEITLTFSVDGRSKSVTEYLGGLAGMPETVSQLEQAVHDIADIKPLIDGAH